MSLISQCQIQIRQIFYILKQTSDLYIYLFFCTISFLITISVDRLPIGYFWWDWIALIGASNAIDQGLIPVRDFWSAHITPLYEVFLAVKIFGIGRGYIGLHFIQFIFVGMLVFILIDNQIYLCSFKILIYLIWILCFFPVNMRNTGYGISIYDIDYAGYLNFNTFYNRFNTSLILLVYIGGVGNIQNGIGCYIINSNPHRLIVKSFFLSIIGLLLFFSKITYFIVFVITLILAFILFNDRAYSFKSIAYSFLIFLIMILVFELKYGFVFKYLIESFKLISFKSNNFFGTEFYSRWAVIKYFYPYDILLLQVSVFILILGSLLSLYYSDSVFFIGQFTGNYNVRLLIYLLFFISSCLLLSMTNNGDSLFIPIITSIYFTLIAFQYNWKRLYSQFCIINTSFNFLRIIISAWMFFYIILYNYWLSSFALTLLPQFHVELNSGVPRLDGAFIVENKSSLRAGILEKNESIHSISENNSDPPHFVNLARSYKVLYNMLATSISNPHANVIALSFPAYLPSVLADFRIPKATFAWFLLNYEISPKEEINVDAVVKEVDSLIVSKCEPNDLNRLILPKLFSSVIENQFQRVDSSECWEIYNRKQNFD